jgi:membrane-bound metal-dependent hydrolase YbcI (DUF457 family)
MPTPVAHSLIGMILGALKFLPNGRTVRTNLKSIWEKKWIFLFCILLANAPDIDYLFGTFYGNWNKFHQAATHSVLFIFVLSVLTFYFLKWRKREKMFSFLFIFILILSHIGLDFFCEDTSPPIGLPLFFPFSYDYFHSSFELFPAVRKKTFADALQIHNIRVVLIEMLLIMPFFFAILLGKGYRRKPDKEQDDGRAKK